MGFLKPSFCDHNIIAIPIKIFSILLLVLIVLLFSVPSSSSEDHPLPAATYYQVFHIKNTTPYFLKNKEPQQWRRYKSLMKSKNKKSLMEYRKKMRGSNIDTRAFSTMLPKGFVPPSGSSPCHNDFPNSITFFCRLSSQKP